jgi:hypothetical protein
MTPKPFPPQQSEVLKYVTLDCYYLTFVYYTKVLLDLIAKASTIRNRRLQLGVGLMCFCGRHQHGLGLAALLLLLMILLFIVL